MVALLSPGQGQAVRLSLPQLLCRAGRMSVGAVGAAPRGSQPGTRGARPIGGCYEDAGLGGAPRPVAGREGRAAISPDRALPAMLVRSAAG